MGGRGGASGYTRTKARNSSGGAPAFPPGSGMGTPQHPASNGFIGAVDGKDISNSWAPPDGSTEAQKIESVMDAQGFRGMPRVVTDQAEFDKAAREAWGGNGLTLYRGYDAPDQQTLKAYSDSLRSGEWYVQCGGGAVHGYGMYAGYAYGGKGNASADQKALKIATNYAGRKSWGPNQRPQKVEKMTLHPSARIAEEGQLKSEMHDHNTRAAQQLADVRAKRKQATSPIVQQLSGGTRAEKAAAKAWQAGKESASPRRGTTAKYQKEFNSAMGRLRKARDTIPAPTRYTDLGVFAASKGYDFYYNRGLGYSVVLNRTKLIVLDK